MRTKSKSFQSKSSIELPAKKITKKSDDVEIRYKDEYKDGYISSIRPTKNHRDSGEKRVHKHHSKHDNHHHKHNKHRKHGHHVHNDHHKHGQHREYYDDDRKHHKSHRNHRG